jgi:tetratricopeptide (TPR) repeat protein
VVGWVIPHLYNHGDPDGDEKLEKAENYEKHAIEVLPAIPKPDNLTDEEFAAAKAGHLEEAHSGLGLVYFRRGDFENAVKELQLATQGTSPDPTDLFALAVGLQQLNRVSEAADAYEKCAQIPSTLQSRCKESAEAVKKAK